MAKRPPTVDLTKEINEEIDKMAAEEGVSRKEVFQRALKMFGKDPNNDPRRKSKK